MNILEVELVDMGRRLIASRRRLWDLERTAKYNYSFNREELKLARREYRALLKLQRELASRAQTRMFE